MPNPKLHQESYSNFGGINTKKSIYLTGQQEFLDLKNMDFQTPGALSQRWGSSLYVAQNFSLPVNSLYEFVRLNGFSGVATGVTGALYFGATTGTAAGLSMVDAGVTIANTGVSLGVYSIVIYGAGYRVANGFGAFTSGGNFKDNVAMPLYNYGTGASGVAYNVHSMPANLYGANKNDYSTFTNELFVADGNKYVKYDGVSLLRVGLPYVTQPLPSDGTIPGFAQLPSGTANLTQAPGLGLTGVYFFAGAYVNNLNFEGPLTPIAFIPAGSFNGGTFFNVVAGGTWLTQQLDIAIPQGFGIQSMNLYSYWQPGTLPVADLDGNQMFNTTFTTTWTYAYRFLRSVPCTAAAGGTIVNRFGITCTRIQLGVTFAQFNNVLQNSNPAYLPNTYDLLSGVTYVRHATTVSGSTLGFADIYQGSPFPKYIEIYQNRLALGGFSGIPSSMILSDTGQPEVYPEELEFEVRTNDGDVITGLKAYNQRLYVFKNNSFHELSGDDASNFVIRQISDEYGCVNNSAIEVFAGPSGEIMTFLDTKGIMEFNGASYKPLSTPIQGIFQTMNVTAAMQTAVMVHDKQRNQLMLGIPVNGATLNNLTVVYDYLVKAWTTYDGFMPSAFSVVRQRFNLPTLLYGNYSGMVNYFDSSFVNDNGTGFTCLVKTRFLHDMGQSVEKQFRRLWLNISEVNNATVPFNVKFYQDYGASVVYQTTMEIAPFQNRIDFGIPAKSMAMEFYKYSATTMVKFYGFATAHRFQRDV